MTTVTGNIVLSTKQHILDQKYGKQLRNFMFMNFRIIMTVFRKLNAVIDLGKQTIRLNDSIYAFVDKELAA